MILLLTIVLHIAGVTLLSEQTIIHLTPVENAQ